MAVQKPSKKTKRTPEEKEQFKRQHRQSFRLNDLELQLKERMSLGYQSYLQRRRENKEEHPLGRPKDYHKSEEEYRQQYSRELSLLRKGISLRNVRQLTGTSVGTLRRLKKYL